MTDSFSFAEEIARTLDMHGVSSSIHDAGDGICIMDIVSCTGKKAGFITALASSGMEAAERRAEKLYGYISDTGMPVIAQDRWSRSPAAMTERLLAHCGIFRSVYARDCILRKIDRDKANAFLESAHSYGGAKIRYCYGLFLSRPRVKFLGTGAGMYPLAEGTMVAVAGFSNARKWMKEGREIKSLEWVRYASMPGVRVNGGMGKMLENFIRDVSPDDVMSYADLEWSDGQTYRKLGFVPEGLRSPVSFIIDPATWERIPVSRISGTLPEGALFFKNLGSVKYRLKLTDTDY